MPFVQTILGDVDSAELGITYSHEHLIFDGPSDLQREAPDMRLTDVDIAVQEVSRFREAGGCALVEMTTAEMGRSPEKLRQISEKTGVHIVAASGFHMHRYSYDFVANFKESKLTEKMISELTIGIDGTGLRAGVIKAATSYNRAYDSELKVIRAASDAHKETGVSISTHTEDGTYALEQINHFKKCAVDPSRLLIGHVDRNPSLDDHLAIAREGVYLGFDNIGKAKYVADSDRIQLILALVERGFDRQIVFSGDMARYSYWPSYGFGYGPGLTNILWNFVPRLVKFGLPVKTIKQFLVDNPATFLANE